MTDIQNALRVLYDEVKDCQKCALAASWTRVVFGSGNPEAAIMFVGEAPGYYEDKEGRHEMMDARPACGAVQRDPYHGATAAHYPRDSATG